MSPLLRSAYSDPIGAGINAFRGVTDIFNQQEDRKMKRELMEREKAAADVSLEQHKLQTEALKENLQFQRETRLRADELRNLTAAKAKFEAGGDLDKDELGLVLRATGGMTLWKDVPPEEWTTLHNNLGTLQKGMEQNWPQISQALQQRMADGFKGVMVDETQAQDWFNALNKVYRSQINRGNDRHGQPTGVEKSISKLYIDGETGTMVPYLRVKDSKDETYFAPMTVDRGNDPQAPLLQLPLQIFQAQLKSNVSMSKMLDAAMMKLGSEETRKRWDSERETLKQNDAFLAGDKAVENLLNTKPNVTDRELQNAFLTSCRAYMKENRIAVKEQDLRNEAGKITRGTQPRILGKKDVEGLSRAWAKVDPNSPTSKQRSQFLQALSEEGIEVTENQLEKYIDDFKSESKIAPEPGPIKQGLEKRKLDIKEREVKTKEEELTSGKKDKFRIEKDAEGNLIRVDVTTGKSSLVTDIETGKSVKGRRELSIGDLRLIDKKSEQVASLIYEDTDIPLEDIDKVKEYASGLFEKEMGLTPIQAKNRAKKDLGIIELPKGVPRGSKLLPQKSKGGNPVYKSPNGKLFEVRP